MARERQSASSGGGAPLVVAEQREEQDFGFPGSREGERVRRVSEFCFSREC